MDQPDPDGTNDQFLADIAALRLERVGREAVLLRIGGALMPIGALVALGAYLFSNSTDNLLDQNDAIITAVIGLILALIGVALFLRYSFAEFLRFWMARLVSLQQGSQVREERP